MMHNITSCQDGPTLSAKMRKEAEHVLDNWSMEHGKDDAAATTDDKATV